MKRSPFRGMTECERVLTAIKAGAETSVDAAELTGLTVKRCSAHLTALCYQRLVRKTGLIQRYARCGRVAYCYEVVR